MRRLADKRTLLGAFLAVLLTTSGCLSIVTGETLEYEAAPGEVSESALDDTAYEFDGQETQTVTRNYSAAGQERTVEVTNYATRYQRAVELGPLGEQELARFVVFTTPAVEVAGQTFNPVGDWSERRLVERLSSEYEGLQDVSHVNNRTVRSLGEDRRVAKFSGEATVLGDRTVDVYVHVTKFRHGDDFVVAVGVHPERLPDEQDRVDDLIRGIDH